MPNPIEIDPQNFKKLYDEGVPYRLLSKHFRCSISTIPIMKRKLGLPKRKVPSYQTKKVDEAKFKEMYFSGATFEQIGEKFGILTPNTISRIVRDLGLPERNLIALRIDVMKFTEDYYAGKSLKRLSRDFKVSFKATQNLIKFLGLPKRKKRNIDNEVKELYFKGYGIRKTAKELKTTARTVSRIRCRLGLPERIAKPQIPDEIIVPDYPEPIEPDPKDPIDPIMPVITNFYNVPTLKQLEKQKRLEETRKAAEEYKQNAWRKNNNR